MFLRPQISDNDAFSAAGLTIEVLAPFKLLEVSYNGRLCLLKEPEQMVNPSSAFTQNPVVDCQVSLRFEYCGPAIGGEFLDDQGQPISLDAETSFMRGHYEQHIQGSGTIRVGDQQFQVNGLGLREHSWGPRYWQNISWYRWVPMCFSQQFAIAATIVEQQNSERQAWAIVLQGGECHLSKQVAMSLNYDDDGYPVRYQLSIDLTDTQLILKAEIVSRIPLRNRRICQNGKQLQTRIIESFTRFECDGLTGYGMTENLDQIIDGVAVGAARGY